MLEKLTYKNHVNEVVDFGSYGVYVKSGDIHDYEWKVSSKGNRISSLTYNVQSRKLPIVIMCDTEAEGIAKRNLLFETFEKDVLSMKHGRIIVGSYYFKCFVTKSTKANYQRNGRYMELALTLTTDYPYWIRETVKSFGVAGSSSDGLDYPMDFSFDYSTDIASTTINNSDFVPTNFRMIVYGACTNPTINIADHTYQVNCSIEENEYLTIDSASKKIYITKNDGSIINHFADRNKESYIFEKIPSGSSSVTWSGDYAFDIVLCEERSEPVWT